MSQQETDESKKDADLSNLSVPMPQFVQFIKEIHAISSCLDALDVAYTVMEETSSTLMCDRTSFFFVDDEYLDLVIAKGVDRIRMPKNSGFAGLCATTGKIINIPDAYQDDRFNSSFDKKSGYHTKQILAAPIVDENENEIIGVLQCINKKSDTPFDEVDCHLLKCLSQQIAVAIRFALQMEEARKAKDQKDALVGYIKQMNANANVASLLFTLNKAAQELLEADRCTFYTVDHENEHLHLISADSSVDIVLNLNQGIAGTVAKSAEKINIPDCYEDSRFDSTWDKKTGYTTKSMLVMPVWADAISKKNQKKPIAVVQLINKNKGESVFDNNDEEILEVLLSFVGSLIKNSTLFIHKKKTKEANKLADLTMDKIALERQPSKRTSSGFVDTPVLEETEEDVFDDLEDDAKEDN